MSGRLVVVLLAALVAAAASACRQRAADSPDRMRSKIAALEKELPELRARMSEQVARDPRLAQMPDAGVRVGVPTALARTLIERVISGFVDAVRLELSGIEVRKAGTVRRVVTLGRYDLRVRIHRVTGALQTGKPQVRFGGNRVAVAMPVRIASGAGDAAIAFRWDGRNVAGAVCGDMVVDQTVSGTVRPKQFPVSGSLQLAITNRQILASPKFPPLALKLEVEPSPESWAALQAILDAREGVCGYVLDKVDIRGVVERLVGRGFRVRLPTEKITPMAVPVSIASSVEVRGEPLQLDVTMADLAITEHMIWLGADATIAEGGEAGRLTPSR